MRRRVERRYAFHAGAYENCVCTLGMMTCGMACLADSYGFTIVFGDETNPGSKLAYECRLDTANEPRKMPVSLCRCKSCLSDTSLLTPC